MRYNNIFNNNTIIISKHTYNIYVYTIYNYEKNINNFFLSVKIENIWKIILSLIL